MKGSDLFLGQNCSEDFKKHTYVKPHFLNVQNIHIKWQRGADSTVQFLYLQLKKIYTHNFLNIHNNIRVGIFFLITSLQKVWQEKKEHLPDMQNYYQIFSDSAIGVWKE